MRGHINKTHARASHSHRDARLRPSNSRSNAVIGFPSISVSALLSCSGGRAAGPRSAAPEAAARRSSPSPRQAKLRRRRNQKAVHTGKPSPTAAKCREACAAWTGRGRQPVLPTLVLFIVLGLPQRRVRETTVLVPVLRLPQQQKRRLQTCQAVAQRHAFAWPSEPKPPPSKTPSLPLPVIMLPSSHAVLDTL